MKNKIFMVSLLQKHRQMEANKVLSDGAFVEYFINNGSVTFEKVRNTESLTPFLFNGKQLAFELSHQKNVESRQKFGDNNIDFEVARVLVLKGLFHHHERFVKKHEFTDNIYDIKISLYVRP